MKNRKTLIYAIIAIVVAIAIICTSIFVVSKKKSKGNDPKETTTISTVNKETTTLPIATTTTQAETTTEAPTTTTTTTTTATTTTTTTTTKPTSSTTKASTTTTKKSTTTTKKPTTTTKKSTTTTKKTTTKAATLTQAQIISNYNAAVNKAVSSKAGYKKVRSTTLNSLEGGALMNNSTVKGAVSNFLGVGNKDFSNAKGQAEFMKNANISSADVKSASYTLANGKYTYTITLKDGSSSAGGSNSNNSPVDKSGIYTGTGDKMAYDHKCAENLASAINNTDGASVSSVTESSKNVKCVAVVNASTGKLESLTVSFDFAVSLSNIKYTVIKINSANGTASTSVKYSNFVW